MTSIKPPLPEQPNIRETQKTLHREDRQAAIKELAVQYPKCFFEEPTLRRPLKNTIVDDLEKDNPGSRGEMERVISNWYRSHFGYQRALIEGAERIDLNGVKAGTVTATEQQNARKFIRDRKKEMLEQREDCWPAYVLPPTATKEQMNGHENMISKTTAPLSLPSKTPPATGLPSLHPSLIPLQDTLTALNEIMTNKQFETVRTALVKTAIAELLREVETVKQIIGGPEAT
jgi:sRNA-binding protein